MIDTIDPVSTLRALRDSVDNIDAAIVHMLAERFKCTRAIARLKARHGLPARDLARDAEQISRLRHLAAVSKLDPDFAEVFLDLVVAGITTDQVPGPSFRRSAVTELDARARRSPAAP